MSDGTSGGTAVMGSGKQALFSLVEAAANSRPIPTSLEPSAEGPFIPGSFKGPSSFGASGGSGIASSTKAHTAMKHRRLSSTGQARRRLSDAREATSRPSPVMLQTAAAALSSLATLSLSGSPPPQGVPQTGTSFASANGYMATSPAATVPKVEAKDDDVVPEDASATPPVKTEINGAGISVTKAGKKRGTIFKCESCSKVYRHPSCLIKHRWEHSPHWREASKFLLSKHQQVQLLEAAAILSHLAPAGSGGTSLPEDRSLWPSFLSGGLLPPPDQANIIHDAKLTPKPRVSSVSTSFDQPIAYPTSSSVPAPSLLSSSTSFSGSASGAATSTGRSPSAGPRMHDYAIPTSGSGITHVRPGVVGVPTDPDAQLDAYPLTGRGVNGYPTSGPERTAPVPVPATSRDAYREPRHATDGGGGYSFISAASVSDAWSSPVSVGFAQSSFRSSVGSTSLSASGHGHSFSSADGGVGGWSLPRSSLRSESRSRSRDRSASVGMDLDDAAGEEEGVGEYVDVDGIGEDGVGVGMGRFGFTSRRWKSQAGMGNEKIEEEWDGMEMEMEM